VVSGNGISLVGTGCPYRPAAETLPVRKSRQNRYPSAAF